MRCSWQEIGIGRAYRSHANWPVYRGERRCIVVAFHHDQTATRPKRYSKIYCTNNLYNWRATKKRECTPIRLRIQTVITSRQCCRRWISWVFLSVRLNFAGHCSGYASDGIMKGMSISKYFASRLAGYWEKSGVAEGGGGKAAWEQVRPARLLRTSRFFCLVPSAVDTAALLRHSTVIINPRRWAQSEAFLALHPRYAL